MLQLCGMQPFHQVHVLYAEDKSGKKSVKRLPPDPEILALSLKTQLIFWPYKSFQNFTSHGHCHNSQDSQH